MSGSHRRNRRRKKQPLARNFRKPMGPAPLHVLWKALAGPGYRYKWSTVKRLSASLRCPPPPPFGIAFKESAPGKGFFSRETFSEDPRGIARLSRADLSFATGLGGKLQRANSQKSSLMVSLLPLSELLKKAGGGWETRKHAKEEKPPPPAHKPRKVIQNSQNIPLENP